jgi:hypothetical protein
VPPYTEGRDRDDDYLIHTAVLAQAEYVLSDDRKHIALDPDEPTIYCHPDTGQVVKAVQPAYFIEIEVNTLHFDLDGVNPGLLSLAHRLLLEEAGIRGEGPDV